MIQPAGEIDTDIGIDSCFTAATRFQSTSQEADMAQATPNTMHARRKFDRTLWTKGTKAANALKPQLAAELAKIIARNQTEYSDLRLEVSVNVRPKSTKGSANVLKSLIRQILMLSQAPKTQTAIRETVEAEFPRLAVNKDWTKPLPKWAADFAQKEIQSAMAPLNRIKIPKVACLRDLHNAAKRELIKEKGGLETFKAVIAISEDAVVINGTAFKITTNRIDGRLYPMLRMSIPGFLRALEKS